MATEPRTMTIQAHSKDCNNITFPNGKEHEGYVPDDIGIGGGDDIWIEIDIDTGKIIGWDNDVRDKILSLQEVPLSYDGFPCSKEQEGL